MNPGSWGPGCVIGVTQNGPTIILDRGLSKWAPMHSKPRSSIGVMQKRLPEGSKAILLHRAQSGSGSAGGAAGAAPGKDSWEGFLQNRNPHRCAIEGGVKDPMGRHDV